MQTKFFAEQFKELNIAKQFLSMVNGQQGQWSTENQKEHICAFEIRLYLSTLVPLSLHCLTFIPDVCHVF